MSTDTDPPTPSLAQNMRRVSYDEFHAAMGPLNVHPSPMGRWDMTTGCVSEWRLQDGGRRLVGITDGGTHLCPRRYWLPA